MKIKVRFAPSPTGFLHLGSARTALFNWVYAKKMGGNFILRVEDTDQQRSKQEFLDEIIDSLKWLGFDWDDIVYQSQRFPLYREYAEKLINSKQAYHSQGAIIFNYDFDKVIFDDLIRGHIEFKELPKNEEVIIKSDGKPTYNFACCVDDALLGITHVIRGEDHISNTPKQILLAKALEFKPPEFAHLPMILSEAGGKMSKRFGATSIREYKEQGFLAPALVNYLLLLGWSPANNKEIFSLKEAVAAFKLDNVNKTAAAFSVDKLSWVNSVYIKNMPLQQLAEIAFEYLKEKEFAEVDFEYLKEVVALFRSRMTKLSDLLDWGYFCFFDDYQYAPESEPILQRKLVDEVQHLRQAINAADEFNASAIELAFRGAVKDLGLKARDLVHPTRVALTGRKVGPGLFETMAVLGKKKVDERLSRLIKYWNKEVE
jgi:glutamyl-tRNA synthetase